MALDLIPRSFWNVPNRLPSLFQDEDWASFFPSSGLSISEDEQNSYVEAAVPGIDPDKVEVTYDKGILLIRGSEETQEGDKNKKFYRKASNSFSYRVAVPGDIDESADPEVVYKNGVMKVTFKKRPEVQPKRLSVKKE